MSTGTDGEYSYIGVEPCGCIPCAIVISHRTEKDVPRELAQWARWHLTIERVKTEGLRTNPAFIRHCEKCRPEKPKKRLPQGALL